jgi:WD40 repeat protein/mono/diheme cytochrome c family protein
MLFLRLLASLALVTSASAETTPVSFRKDIAPLLQRRCVACHGEESAKGGYRLDSFKHLGKAGESDLPPLVASQAEKSELYRLLIEPEANDRMPQKADALPAPEIALVERWIREGATNDGGSPERPLAELVRETLLLSAPEQYARAVPATALAFSPDGTQLAVAGYYEVTLWNVDTGALERRLGGLPERITALAWNAKRNLLAVAGGSPSQWGGVWLVEPARDFRTRLLCDLPETSLSVAFAPDGKQLVASAGDRTIRLFDTASGKQTRLWKAHADWVQTVAFAPDGARFISASRDRTARIFDLASGAVLTTYTGHEAAVLAAAFPPRASTAISVTRGQPVQQWDASDGKLAYEYADAGRNVQVILPTDSGLLTGSTDHLVRLLQYSDRRLLLTFFGHRDCIDSLAVAPDRRTFASGDHAGEVCVWSTACETPIRRFVAKP